jgi:hypothetical protein
LTSSNMVPAGTESLYAGTDARRDGTIGVFDQVGEGDDGCERNGDLERCSSTKQGQWKPSTSSFSRMRVKDW